MCLFIFDVNLYIFSYQNATLWVFVNCSCFRMFCFQVWLIIIISGEIGTLKAVSNNVGDLTIFELWYPVYLPLIPSIFLPADNKKASCSWIVLRYELHSKEAQIQLNKNPAITNLGTDACCHLAVLQNR